MKRKNFTRREFIKTTAAGTASVMLGAWACQKTTETQRPNIIYILADDLGYGELGCYGQKKIKTPNIDRLAAEGMRFTQHYSGSPVCAPSRCMLLTGKHSGHAYIRNNDEMREKGDVWNDPSIEGQRPLPPGTTTIGTLLQSAGYTTAAIGKWGLGTPEDSGNPNKQGFDLFYGYICQRQAHNYYPTHLWRNSEKDMLNNPYFSPRQRFPEDKDPNDPAAYAPYTGNDYAPDLMIGEALEFIKNNRQNPFFLYFASPIPHLALQVPEDSLQEYQDAFPETPYLGDKGYTPHRTPRAAYAAMISRLDGDVGRIMALLKELGLDDNTLILFSSDNGPTYTGGVDYTFFASAGPLNGLKGSLYEGGIRVPMLARWPGKIPAGTQSDRISAFWDVLPTLCEITGAAIPEGIDGISLAPVLLNRGKVPEEHPYLYWEFPGYGGQQALRMGNWKAIRREMNKGNRKLELYNLEADIGEKQDLAEAQAELIAKMEKTMQAARTPSEFAKWNFMNQDPEE